MTLNFKISLAVMMSALISCGGGNDTNKIGSPQVATGAYQLTSVTFQQGCSDDFLAFLVANAGALQSGNSILDVTTTGQNSINATLRGTSLSVVLTSTDGDRSITGSLTGTKNYSDCILTESLHVTIQDTGKTIALDLGDSWSNVPASGLCPFVQDSCTNTFSYVGNPL